MRGVSHLPVGPSRAMSEVTKSVWSTGSVCPELFTRVYDQARELRYRAQSEVWQDVFALSIDGRIVPKHAPLSSLVAVPFFAIFGDRGF